MNVSLEWLRQFVPTPTDLDPQEAADALMRGGFPIESITQAGPHNDTVLDVEVTSNRPDCLSHIGVARELAALTGRAFKGVEPAATESATPASGAVGVSIEAMKLCPHYTARVLRNVKVGPSPAWMVRRLEAVGLRSINNVVDVTNYVMFELGQPLHAFDYDKLRGRQVVVREARLGEKITSIDGHERRLEAGMLVIADAERPVALAGVMGGLDTEVSASTTNVLLEAARFDALSVRRTARALAMKSDSSYRFERGIDATLPERASLRAAQLLLEIAGGELLSGVVAAGDAGHAPKQVTLRLPQLKRILGVDLPADRVVGALDRVHLSPALSGDVVTVTVPSWRLDLGIEADLIEEAARVVGYEQIPTRDEISIRLTPPEPAARTTDTIATALVAAGYFEAVTFSFVTDALADDFVPPQAKSLARVEPATRKADARLRPSLLPGLVEAVRRNEAAGTLGAKLFETGSAFWYGADGSLVETRRLALAGGTDLRDTRGVVDALLARLDVNRPVTVTPDRRPGYANGACGRVEWAGEAIGYLGKLDRAVADKLGLREPVCLAELDLLPLLVHAQHVPQLKPLPRFPAVERDLTLDLPEQTQYAAVESLVTSLKLPALEALNYVGTYRGKQLEKGRKSVTVQFVFRSPTETLTADQVDAGVQRVIDAAKQQLGATLRS